RLGARRAARERALEEVTAGGGDALADAADRVGRVGREVDQRRAGTRAAERTDARGIDVVDCERVAVGDEVRGDRAPDVPEADESDAMLVDWVRHAVSRDRALVESGYHGAMRANSASARMGARAGSLAARAARMALRGMRHRPGGRARLRRPRRRPSER